MLYSNINESKVFDFDTYCAKLPFYFYQNTIKLNIVPEKFKHHFKDLKKLSSEIKRIKIKPSHVTQKEVLLYPLFESNPKYSSLSMPDDLFGFDKNGLVFTIASSNLVNKEKSKIYNDIFKQQGAVFPFKKAFGNPTTRKAFDEGYFLLDSKKQVFHLKQINNKPYIKKLSLNNINTKYIIIQENIKKEYYGLLISDKNEVFLLTYDNYKLIKFDINYKYDEDIFLFQTTPINRIISIEKLKDKIKTYKTYVYDLNYKLIKQNSLDVSLKTNLLYENIQEWIFPYKIILIKTKKPYAFFKFSEFNYKSFLLYFIIGLIYFIKRKDKKLNKANIIKFFMIIFGGIYAIISLFAFKKIYASSKL